MSTETTRTQIVQHAQRLIQEHGCNGFSYRDLAALIGIKTSSIHYHFPCKNDLLLAVVRHYHAQWREAIDTIDPTLGVDAKLRAYLDVHSRAFGDTNLVCLGGALAAEVSSVSAPVRAALRHFYRANESWLAQLLEQGECEGTLRVPGHSATMARALFAALQGGLLGARLFNSTDRLRDVMRAPPGAAY